MFRAPIRWSPLLGYLGRIVEAGAVAAPGRDPFFLLTQVIVVSRGGNAAGHLPVSRIT